jgi:hypothetical protein
MTSAYKFLAPGAFSPFTGFRWPGAGTWVSAQEEREARWVFACRRGDLAYWLERELWRVELGEPVRETRYQISAPRARLVTKVEAWNADLHRGYAAACALRARDLALASLPSELRGRLAEVDDLPRIVAVVRGASKPSATTSYVGDAAENARSDDAAATSYIACIVAASLGGGANAFEAERAWQAAWISQQLGLIDE